MALAGLMGMAAFLAVGWVAFLYAQRSQNRFQLFARLGLGLLGLCLVVRIALALTIGSDGVYGSDPYPRYAENLATGQGYSYYPDEPTAYLPPGWPMVLSGFYFLFGVSNWTILLATTLIGIGLGFDYMENDFSAPGARVGPGGSQHCWMASCGHSLSLFVQL